MNRSSDSAEGAKHGGEPAVGFGDATEAARGAGFGRRRERPDANLMPVLNTGAPATSFRVPRSVSPPLD